MPPAALKVVGEPPAVNWRMAVPAPVEGDSEYAGDAVGDGAQEEVAALCADVGEHQLEVAGKFLLDGDGVGADALGDGVVGGIGAGLEAEVGVVDVVGGVDVSEGVDGIDLAGACGEGFGDAVVGFGLDLVFGLAGAVEDAAACADDRLEVEEVRREGEAEAGAEVVG